MQGLTSASDLILIREVELFTKEKVSRTKCWRVAVPFKFKDLMEKDDMYPSGWQHRKFFGSRKGKDKKARVDEDPLVQQTLQLQQQQREQVALQSEQVTDNDEITNSQKLAWDVLDGTGENSQSLLSQ